MRNLVLKPVLIALGLAFATGFALGLLNAFARSHGGTPMPATQIGAICAAVAGLGVFVGHQLRGNRHAAQASEDDERRAKAFNAVPDCASVYVFRDAFFAKLVGFELRVDGRVVGQTRGKTFFALALAPGEHTLSSINPQDGSQADLALSLSAGQICYVEQRVRFAAKGPSHALATCDERAAQDRVRRCRLLNAAATS